VRQIKLSFKLSFRAHYKPNFTLPQPQPTYNQKGKSTKKRNNNLSLAASGS